MQDHLLGFGQWPLRAAGLRLLVVDPVGDGDGLALHLNNLEWLRWREPGIRHDRQDALHGTGKTCRKGCHKDMRDVRRIPRQLHDTRVGGSAAAPGGQLRRGWSAES